MSENLYVRYRFSVPKADQCVIEWLRKQNNISQSIRILIREYIRRYGMTDATCNDAMLVINTSKGDSAIHEDSREKSLNTKENDVAAEQERTVTDSMILKVCYDEDSITIDIKVKK